MKHSWTPETVNVDKCACGLRRIYDFHGEPYPFYMYGKGGSFFRKAGECTREEIIIVTQKNNSVKILEQQKLF